MESERNEKQLFLQQEIIDKNYDTDLFTLWIETQKDDGKSSPHNSNLGANIDNWSMEELKEIVAEFQGENQPLSFSKKSTCLIL